MGVPAVRRLIRDGRTAHIREAMAAAGPSGMLTLERSLATLVESGVLDLDTAVDASLYPQDLTSGPVLATT